MDITYYVLKKTTYIIGKEDYIHNTSAAVIDWLDLLLRGLFLENLHIVHIRLPCLL